MTLWPVGVDYTGLKWKLNPEASDPENLEPQAEIVSVFEQQTNKQTKSHALKQQNPTVGKGEGSMLTW